MPVSSIRSRLISVCQPGQCPGETPPSHQRQPQPQNPAQVLAELYIMIILLVSGLSGHVTSGV